VTENTETHYLETLYQELALALGDAVWAFARIEWLTFESIGKLTTDRLDEIVGNINFRSRTSILKKLVERKDSIDSVKKKALKLITEAEKLSEKRNIIVHNPWRIWVDLDARDFMTEIQKYSNKDKKVNLKELRDFIESASKLENQLKEALNAL